MKKLIILSGLPGSGKSTYAKMLAPAHALCSTDEFPGLYSPDGSFNAELLGEAHAWNQAKAERLMEAGEPTVVVDNTNTCRWEYHPYMAVADLEGYVVSRVSIYDGGFGDEALAARNRHGVPVEAIERMRERYEHDMSGDVRPPWER